MISLRNFTSAVCIFCLAVICLLVNATGLKAQQTSLLRVVAISGEDGNPLAGANVLLYGYGKMQDEEELLYNCVTNRDGLCEIRNILPEKEYELRVTFVGYKSYLERITLTPGERRILRTTLESDITEFEEVTVERRRYITTGEAGVRRISSVDIARIPTPGVGGDLVSYLQTVPGVITSGDRGGDLFIRGGTPDQNLILVDNLPIIKPFHISNLFSAFPVEIIQSVDMYAGGFGVEYTGATSAVIDVSLRPGNMRDHKGSVAVSPYLFSLHLEGPLEKDRQSFILMGRKSTIERFAPALTGKELSLQFSDIVGRYSIQEDNIFCNVTGVRTYDRGQIVPEREIMHSWSNTVIGARCLGFDERFNHPIEATVGYTDYRNTEGTVEKNERLSSISQLYMNIDLQEEIFGLPVDYGFGVSFRTYNTELDEKFTSLRSFQSIVPIAYLYSSAGWTPNRRLTFQPGIASQLTLDTPISLEPRLRISYQPDGTDSQEISLAFGRYVQLVSGISDERDVGTVFTVLKPIERGDPLPSSMHGILAYQQRMGNYFVANVEGYVKRHKNIHVSKWNPEVGLEIETALANGFTYGFDVRFMYNNNTLYASLGYGWSKVEYEAVSGDLGAWIEEPVFRYSPAHDQRHKVNTVISYRFSEFTASASWEFGTGMPYTRIFGFDMSVRVPFEEPQTDPGTARTLFSRPYGERLPYYHRLDISIERSFQLIPGLSLDAEIGVINVYDRNNIFNFDFHTLQRVDQTPILPYLSVKLNKL